MDTFEQIKKQKQVIIRDEKSLALTKLKKRKADTRRKIEFGGLVIKAGMGEFNKSVILGAICYANSLIQNDYSYKELFSSIGNSEFIKSF